MTTPGVREKTEGEYRKLNAMKWLLSPYVGEGWRVTISLFRGKQTENGWKPLQNITKHEIPFNAYSNAHVEVKYLF